MTTTVTGLLVGGTLTRWNEASLAAPVRPYQASVTVTVRGKGYLTKCGATAHNGRLIRRAPERPGSIAIKMKVFPEQDDGSLSGAYEETCFAFIDTMNIRSIG